MARSRLCPSAWPNGARILASRLRWKRFCMRARPRSTPPWCARRLQKGDALLVDYGPEVDHYVTDITRTWPVSGRFEGRLKELYEAVLAAQQAEKATRLRPYVPPPSERRIAVAQELVKPRTVSALAPV